jgi:hypothetical protein
MEETAENGERGIPTSSAEIRNLRVGMRKMGKLKLTLQ